MRTEKKSKQAMVLGDWLYFTDENVDVRRIYDALPEETVEIWEDAGILEIALGEKSSLDIEAAEIPARDEAAQSFAKEHGCKKVFLITFSPEDYDAAVAVMNQIIKKCQGICCGDTQDFTPVMEIA